jgi:hypothetical protein
MKNPIFWDIIEEGRFLAKQAMEISHMLPDRS